MHVVPEFVHNNRHAKTYTLVMQWAVCPCAYPEIAY